MSATGRNVAGHERNVDDFYETPGWATRAILPHLNRTYWTIDPFAGRGAILRELVGEWGSRFGFENSLEVVGDPANPAAGIVFRDSLSSEPWFTKDEPVCVITNPPYGRALECVQRAILETRGVTDCAFLLRLAFLESKKRQDFHKAHPCDLFVLPRRPSFAHGKTDSAAYAWFVWGPRRGNRWHILDCESAEGTDHDAPKKGV
jgi:hypothetical protein